MALCGAVSAARPFLFVPRLYALELTFQARRGFARGACLVARAAATALLAGRGLAHQGAPSSQSSALGKRYAPNIMRVAPAVPSKPPQLLVPLLPSVQCGSFARQPCMQQPSHLPR